jgi:DNA-directed RNA polymerase subunit RPC12/RpoP
MSDPGLFTDSTGEGQYGDSDVSLLTQKNLKETYYNGSKPCADCGSLLDPFTALHTERCTKCNNRKSQTLLKNRMVAE